MESQITGKALKIMEIAEGNLCDHCLGRTFSKTVEGPDNKYRGEYVRHALNETGVDASTADSCYICCNIFDDVENRIIDKIITKINRENIEFSTFLVGCRVSPEILSKEEEIHKNMELDVENIKKEINREIGKKLYFTFNKEVEFDNPNIVIMVDFVNDNIDIQINPIFIEGRYRKLVRGIPQTKWPCGKCRGKGCPSCNYTGKQYPETVEELISPEAIKLACGSESKFHGAGREDIDVKMLGNGRPFVLEIKEPKIRNLDLETLEEKINTFAGGKVEVQDLKFVGKDRKGTIKCSSTDTYKVYSAIVELENDINEDKLNLLSSMEIIKQRTPIRVSHRRADKIRTRTVRNITTKPLAANKFEMIVECEGGLYIKELISGDEGRSKPSISEILGVNARCIQLDVLEVNI
ncbi:MULTISPECIES: tRNA pseudouridine(54/55) synthase Pus10 [Methanobacterium]|uniref:tRNA pseudouridine synthase Pus10 n=1 Tax=Methanobacterium veterum TaxID=408577 RepID=A0A9E5DKX9_9EURY|nr:MULTISPECIES: tRNA pseudouridine(54/55) synthase Pus10 [Methanobacterium]MCZ3365845.1 tRNA pseudouridine(54/55) synthase Pus10 [Methanobacterium veterum]MCZ3371310.1 tRNA pseudouridine(54/55) synthase Pus10 [Methanobacterium veterum]